MASAFSHALMAITIGKTYSTKISSIKFIVLGCFCAVIPDADVIMNHFVAYESFFGHRGFFHSFFFCFLLAVLITYVFFRKEKLQLKTKLIYILFFFLCGASHGLLDMLTNGGRGVAIFSPFDNTRYFFPWRPIKVSPIGIAKFFSERGLKVIQSEMIWIGIPCFLYMFFIKLIRKGNNRNK
jgi:inner membrane protein